MTNINDNLKLYYTFGRETLDFSKEYIIRNIVESTNNAKISNPLCICSKNTFLSDMSFMCCKDLIAPEEQLGTLIIPSIILNDGFYLLFWLNIIKIDSKNYTLLTLQLTDTNYFIIKHDDKNFIIEINLDGSNNNFILSDFTINTKYLFGIKFNNSNGRFLININNKNIFFSENKIKTKNNISQKYKNIIFGSDDRNLCAYFYVNEIRIYNSLNDELVPLIYNNGNGIKSSLMFGLNIQLSKELIGLGEDAIITFNSEFKRLPLKYELNIYYNNIKNNYLKDSINSSYVIKDNIYSTELFSKIIYVKSNENIINIDTNINGIKVIDVQDIDVNSNGILNLTQDAELNNYKLIELNDNSIYLGLLESNMNTIPTFINNFMAGVKGNNQSNIVSFNGGSDKVYNIYIYKFNDSQNIYYFLDKAPQNKFSNFSLLQFNLPLGIYDIYAEFITDKYIKLQSNSVKLIVKSQQKILRISCSSSLSVNDYGMIKIDQENPIVDNITTIMVKNNINNSQLSYSLEKNQNLFIFTPNLIGVYYITAKREADGYGTVVSNTISVLVYDGKQDILNLSADPIIAFPNNILLTVNDIKNQASTKLFYKHSTDQVYSSIKMEALTYPFKPLKLGNYSFYAFRKLINFQDISSNIINVTVKEGNQPQLVLKLDKSIITYGDDIGIIINQVNRLPNSQTIIDINYENKNNDWEPIITFYNLPSSYYYYKINSNTTGNATIRVTNKCNMYSDLVVSKIIQIKKLLQTTPTIEVKPINTEPYTQINKQIIEGFFAETSKYIVQNNTININYNSAVQIILSNLTFNSDIIITQDNNNVTINKNDTLINIYGNTAGTCILTIKKVGNIIYNDINIQLQVNINKISQPLIQIGLEDLVGQNGYYTVPVNRDKKYNFLIGKYFENPSIVFNSNSPICKIFSTYLIPYNSGLCTIYATLGETTNYLETNTSSFNLNIIKNIQNELIYDNINNISVGNKVYLNVTGGTTTNDIILNSLTPEQCSIYGLNKIQAIQTGNCMIKATKPGNYLYDDTEATIKINIQRSPQPPTFITIDNLTKITNNNYDYGLIIDITKTYTLKLNGALGNPSDIVFISSDSNICSISGNILKTVKSGFCNIKAIIPEQQNYYSSESEILNINIIKKSQIDFALGSMPNVYFGDTISLPITGGTLSGQILLTSDTPNNCVIQNNKILVTNAGTCTITAFMEGNEYYDSIKKGINIQANKKPQPNLNIIIQNSQIDQSNNIVYLPVNKLEPYFIEPTGLLENPNVIYQLSNINALNQTLVVCKLNDNKIYALSEGTCTLKLTTTETTNYISSVSQLINITVIKSAQTDINFNEIPPLNYNNTIKLNISGGSGTGNLILTSDSSNCQINGLNIIAKNSGQCNITATKSADDTYFVKSAKITINVNKILQPQKNILISDLANPTNILQDVNGNCLLRVNRNKTYLLSISGLFENPNITYNIINTYTQNQDPICTINNNLLMAYSEGSCLIEGVINETQNYTSSKTKTIIVTVIKTEQNDFIMNTTPTFYYNNPTYLDIKGGSTTQPIIFQSTTLSTCSISDNVVFSNDVGECNIKATKPGGFFYYDKVKDYTFKIQQEFQPPIDIIIEGKTADLSSNILGLPTLFVRNKLIITSETGNNSFKNGEYTVSSSSNQNDVFNIFRNQTVTPWVIVNSTYELNTGNYNGRNAYTGIVGSKSMLFGEWIQIQLPYNLKITSYNILNNYENSSNCPQKFYLLGSIDSFTWYLLDSQNIQVFPENKVPLNFNVVSNNSFSYYRLVINKLRGGNINSTNISLLQWNIQGLYTNNTYTLIVDSTINYNLKLQGIQDNATYTLSATSNYSIDPNFPVVKIIDNKLYGYSAGVCVLTANINATNKYLSATSNPLIIVVMKKEAATITSEPIPPLYYGSSVNATFKAASKLELKSMDPNNCSILGTTISGLNAGKCTINVKIPETREAKGSELNLSLTVLKVEQTNFTLVFDNISMDISDNITFFINRNKEYAMSITGLKENPIIKYNIITNYSLEPNEPVVKLNENKLIAYNAGVCLIQADINETQNYKAAKTSPIIITVNKNKQIPLNYDVNSLIYNKNSTLTIGGGSTKNNILVDINQKSKPNCKVQNKNQFISNEVSYGVYDINATRTGECKLSATKLGDFNYEDVQLNIPLIVNKSFQSQLNVNVTKKEGFNNTKKEGFNNTKNTNNINNNDNYDDFSNFAPF